MPHGSCHIIGCPQLCQEIFLTLSAPPIYGEYLYFSFKIMSCFLQRDQCLAFNILAEPITVIFLQKCSESLRDLGIRMPEEPRDLATSQCMCTSKESFQTDQHILPKQGTCFTDHLNILAGNIGDTCPSSQVTHCILLRDGVYITLVSSVILRTDHLALSTSVRCICRQICLLSSIIVGSKPVFSVLPPSRK